MSETKNEIQQQESQRGVLEIIREIKSGMLNPRNLGQDERRLCVAHFRSEGLSVPEIAQIIRVSDKTIQRDRRAISESNAIKPDPKFAAQYAGHLAAEAEACATRIRRVTRDKKAPHSVKVDGERACFEIFDRLGQRLQSMGFLPQATQRVEADLTHNLGDLSSITDLKNELERLESVERRVSRAQTLPPTIDTPNNEAHKDDKGGSR
jgi:hypothetical protein